MGRCLPVTIRTIPHSINTTPQHPRLHGGVVVGGMVPCPPAPPGEQVSSLQSRASGSGSLTHSLTHRERSPLLNAPSTTRTCDLRFRRPLKARQNPTQIADTDTRNSVFDDGPKTSVAQKTGDPRLQRLMSVWNELPEPARAAISTLSELHPESFTKEQNRSLNRVGRKQL